LRALVDAHTAAITDYLRRRLQSLPSADVDDLVSETFIVLWRRIADVPTGESERPWVIGVARNVMHNAHRSAYRRRHHEGRVRARSASPSAEDEALADVAARGALAALAPADRELLMLHYWDGLDVSAIALVLHLSPNAAGTRLSRAKARFLEHLGDDPLGTGAPPLDMEGGDGRHA
jgi:RNA polymerase sigma factor (sigma-70 family)